MIHFKKMHQNIEIANLIPENSRISNTFRAKLFTISAFAIASTIKAVQTDSIMLSVGSFMMHVFFHLELQSPLLQRYNQVGGAFVVISLVETLFVALLFHISFWLLLVEVYSCLQMVLLQNNFSFNDLNFYTSKVSIGLNSNCHNYMLGRLKKSLFSFYLQVFWIDSLILK